MVAVFGLRINFGILNSFFQGITYHAIINTPAFIFCTGVGSEAPPGIMMWFFVNIPEGVDKTTLKKRTYPGPFLR